MYQTDEPDNLVAFLEGSVAKYPDNLLFGTKNPGGTYDWIAYKEVGKRVDNLRGGLASIGIGKDDAIGIIANNRVEWAVAAFAGYGLGARYIPMYQSELVHIWKYIINDSSVKVLFVSKPEIYEKVIALKPDYADALNNLAWLLVTSPDKKLRDEKRALMLAKRAVALKRNSTFLDTLAEACFENGLRDEAVKNIKEAISLATDNRDYYIKQLQKFQKRLKNLSTSFRHPSLVPTFQRGNAYRTCINSHSPV